MKALSDQHHGDFDYLLGDWEFTSVSKQYGPGRGFWSAIRLPGGELMDEFRVVSDTGETYHVTATIRAYNAAWDRWDLVSMGGAGGLQDVGKGQRVGQEVHIEQTFGATGEHPSVLRIRYYDIQLNRFSWRADRSIDGGKTWIADDQRIEAHRVGPPRSLAPMTPANPANVK